MQVFLMDMLLHNPHIISALIFTMVLPACSSHIPLHIRQPVEDEPAIEQVHRNMDSYLTQKVRWGGTIVHTENKQNTSWLSIVAFPLNSEGRPLQNTKSPGRFIAIVDEFLEPLVYNTDRQITVVGTIVASESRNVGEFLYDYPVIKVQHHFYGRHSL